MMTTTLKRMGIYFTTKNQDIVMIKQEIDIHYNSTMTILVNRLQELKETDLNKINQNKSLLKNEKPNKLEVKKH